MEIIMNTPKEIAFSVAYEKYHADYDALRVTYEAAIDACEETFKAARYVADEAFGEKNYSDNWARLKGLAVHSQSEKVALRAEQRAAVATARKSMDASKAFADQAHIYETVVLAAVLKAAEHAAYDPDAVAANVAQYRAARDHKKIVADNAAESPAKIAADKAAYKDAYKESAPTSEIRR